MALMLRDLSTDSSWTLMSGIGGAWKDREEDGLLVILEQKSDMIGCRKRCEIWK